MSNTPVQTFPPVQSQAVDSRGMFTAIWAKWLQTLYTQIGNSTTVSLTQIQATQATHTTQIAALQANVTTLQNEINSLGVGRDL